MTSLAVGTQNETDSISFDIASLSDKTGSHLCEENGAKGEEQQKPIAQSTKNTVSTGWNAVWNRLSKLPDDWPRTFFLAFGVVAPVLLLLCISLFFGFFLADLESDQEIVDNNAIISDRAEFSRVSQFLGNVSAQVPRICLSVVIRNDTSSDDFSLESEIRRDLLETYTRVGSDQGLNLTDENADIRGIDRDEIQDLFQFMEECGAIVWRLTEEFTGSEYATANDLGSLSFNWIRCYGRGSNNTDNTFNQVFGSYVRQPLRNVTQLRPDLQESNAVREWTAHRALLEKQYLEELLINTTDIESRIAARVEAYQRSLRTADGFSQCEPSSDAGAWFWFTIMTTIGYGNTAPATSEGRVLVYTVGFLSILLFAVVLGSAGNILTAIVDDFVDRVKCLSALKRPWIACALWGALYYLWMSVVAWKTVYWKESRLGESFDFYDAYWFSFITTTTVGLGDYYLEHQVMLRRDLVSFSLLILVGFIFLANFLVKLTDVLKEWFPRTGSESFEAKLKRTRLLRPGKRDVGDTAETTGDNVVDRSEQERG